MKNVKSITSNRLTMRMNRFLGVILVLFMAIGCQEDLGNLEATEKPEEQPEIYVQDGILSFSTPEVFETTERMMQNMDKDARLQWSKQFEFESLLSSLVQAREEQDQILERIEQLESLVVNMSDLEVNRFIEANADEINLLEQRLDVFPEKYAHLRLEHDLVVGMKLHNPFVASLIDIHGFVRVGDYLLQYTEDKIKLMRETDNARDNLANAETTNEELELFVSDIEQVALLEGDRGREVNQSKNCGFNLKPDGSSWGSANLATSKTQTASYRWETATRCWCAEYSEGGGGEEGEEDGECLRTECETYQRYVFAGWVTNSIVLTGGLATFKESCWVAGIFCRTSSLKSNLSMTSQGFYFNDYYLQSEVSLFDATQISFARSYNIVPNCGPCLTPSDGSRIVVTYKANSGGYLGSCGIEVTL